MGTLSSENVGQFAFGRNRLEYSEFGSGEMWVVLIHGQLIPRRMHDPLARHLASEGLHVVSVDLLGHGRSDRPEDPRGYSMAAFAEQVVALLDHLGARTAVIGGTSLGANVSLCVAVSAPERVQGLILEMPVLDNAVEAVILAFAPLMFVGRLLPWGVRAVAAAARLVPLSAVPFWVGIAAETLQQRPGAMAATVHGLFFGSFAPSAKQRRNIAVPTLVIGHPYDPIHLSADARLVADEIAGSTLVEASSILEWRLRPGRLNQAASDFARSAWGSRSSSRSGPRTRRRGR